MTNTHFEEHVLYHDALDRREAKERAMNAEIDDLAAQYEARTAKEMSESIAETDPERCRCLEIVGDDDDCPVHGLAAQECECGPNPDAPACPSCRARGESRAIPF